MKFKATFSTTIIMAAVLFLLAVYVIVVELPQEKKAKEAEQSAERLFNFESNDVKAVLLRYPGSEIHLEKTDTGTWRLTQPIQAEADQREVQSLVSTVSDLRFTRVVEEQITNPAEFGLAHPNAEIALTLPDRTEKVMIGDDGPMANSLYVERDRDQRVVLAQQWIKGALAKTVFDLRTKIILPVKHAEISELRLDFPKQSFLLAKQGDHWFLKNPIEGGADDDTLSSLTLMLENLRADSFIDPGPELEKIRKGLKKPLATLTIRHGESSQTAQFYNAPEKENVYVVTEPDKPIYRVAKANMDELKPELFHYRDKRLIDVQRELIKGIEIRTPSEQFTLTANDKGWMIKGDDRPVNADRVKRLLDQLEKLKAYQAPEKPVKNPATVGLKAPVNEIRLTDQTKKSLATLRLGNDLKGLLYAQGNPKLGIVLVNKDFLDEIPRKSELLKKEQPAGKK